MIRTLTKLRPNLPVLNFSLSFAVAFSSLIGRCPNDPFFYQPCGFVEADSRASFLSSRPDDPVCGFALEYTLDRWTKVRN